MSIAPQHGRGAVLNTLRLPAAWVRPQREHCTTVPLSVAGTAWFGSAPYRSSTRTCSHTVSFAPAVLPSAPPALLLANMRIKYPGP